MINTDTFSMKDARLKSIVIAMFGLCSSILSQTTPAESSFAQELQHGCAQVKSYAHSGKRYYDRQQYPQALTQFKHQAAWSAFCLINMPESNIQITQRDVEVANNNVGLTYLKLKQPQWARAWFLRDPESKISQFNLKQLPARVQSTAHDLSGYYVYPSGLGQWNSLTVEKNKSNYSIHFEGYYFGLRGLIYGPNMGTFNIDMPLKSDLAQFQTDGCKIQLQFQNNRIMVTQDGDAADCGFGHNVYAAGDYLKVENAAD